MDLKHSEYYRGFLINIYKEGKIYRVKTKSKLSKEIEVAENFNLINDGLTKAKEKIDKRFVSVD